MCPVGVGNVTCRHLLFVTVPFLSLHVSPVFFDDNIYILLSDRGSDVVLCRQLLDYFFGSVRMNLPAFGVNRGKCFIEPEDP